MEPRSVAFSLPMIADWVAALTPDAKVTMYWSVAPGVAVGAGEGSVLGAGVGAGVAVGLSVGLGVGSGVVDGCVEGSVDGWVDGAGALESGDAAPTVTGPMSDVMMRSVWIATRSRMRLERRVLRPGT
jgi:hypothetical protein